MPDKARPDGTSDRPKPPARRPSLALALGGGGARGLAHIVILEALDEMGIKPRIIAGTSIGAIFGAAYASGLSAAEIRVHTELVLGQRLDLVRDLFAARAVSLRRFWNMFAARSALLDAKAVLDIVLPSRVKSEFAELPIPLKVVASDFYAQEPVIFGAGALRPAVAASMALPVIFQPVMYGGRALIDGGLTNPLPFDLLTGEADIIAAIDVSGAPVERHGRDQPTAFETLWATSFIFERSIVKEKLRWRQPDIYIDGGTSHFQVGEFWKFEQILAAAAPAKERFKAQLSRILAAETLPITGPVPVEATQMASEEAAAPAAESRPKRRRLLGSRRRAPTN